jgi:peroxiredoxin
LFLWIVWITEALSKDGAYLFYSSGIFRSIFTSVIFTKKRMSIQPGQIAPCFTLFDSEKNKISLGDYSGRKNVLLLFFPLAFTRVCTKELCLVRDDIGRYNNDEVQVLGISVDSVYTLAKYREEQHYNYPLLSDFNREVSTLYETIYDSFSDLGMKGVSKRSAFIIDKQGIIQYEEVLEIAKEMPNFEAINEIIERLSISRTSF